MVPDITCVLVHWYCTSELKACLLSLVPAWENCRMRIVLVNNGSAEPLEDILPEGLPVELLQPGSNLGFGPASNLGAEQARGRYLLFLNPDVIVLPGSIELMREWMNRNPQAAGVGAMLLCPSGKPQYGFMARRFPSLSQVLADSFFLDKIPFHRFYRHGYGEGQLDLNHPTPVDQPAGACLMIRRDWFLRAGGFDPRFYPAWYEDVDLCFRMSRSGARFYFLPFSVFQHLGGSSMRTLPWPEFMQIYYRNQLLFFKKHFSWRYAVLVKTGLFLGIALRFLLLPASFPKGAASRITAARGFLMAARSLLRLSK